MHDQSKLSHDFWLVAGVMKAVMETIADEPEGVPGGMLYAALASKGCTLDGFQKLMGVICATGRVVEHHNRYYPARSTEYKAHREPINLSVH